MKSHVQVLGAAVAWTVAVGLAVGATFSGIAVLMVWAVLTGLVAHLLTVAGLSYPGVEEVIERIIADANRELIEENERTVERVAGEMAEALCRESARPTLLHR